MNKESIEFNDHIYKMLSKNKEEIIRDIHDFEDQIGELILKNIREMGKMAIGASLMMSATRYLCICKHDKEEAQDIFNKSWKYAEQAVKDSKK